MRAARQAALAEGSTAATSPQMVVALAAHSISELAGAMERSGSYQDPHQACQQQGPPPGSPALPTGSYAVFYNPAGYYSYPPQQQPQPHPMQPYHAGMRPFQAPGGPYQMWYGQPAFVAPVTGALLMGPGGMPQQQMVHGYTQSRPLMRPPGMIPPGMVPLAMQPPMAPPRFQQERVATPRGKYLIPGNGVRSSSTSSIKRGSTGSSVRSLSDDVTDQRLAASAEAPAPEQQPKDDSNAHAPCAFFLRTGTCAYGSRCDADYTCSICHVNIDQALSS